MPDSGVGPASRLARIKTTLALLPPGKTPPGPPLSPAAIAALEAQHRVSLPAELRRFAEDIGLGGAGPGGGLHTPSQWLDAIMDPTPDILALPCPLDPARRFGDYTDVEDPAQGAVALSSDGPGSLYTLLIVSGANRGHVIRYQIESEWSEWVETAWPRERAGFLDWYEGWLDLAVAGIHPNFYGAALIGPEPSLVRAITERPLDEPTVVRALMGLSYFPAPTADTLTAIAGVFASGSPRARAAALPLLARHAPDGRSQVSQALKDPAPEVRLAAAQELAVTKTESAPAELEQALDDPDDRVAESALLKLRDTGRLDVQVLERLYNRPTPSLREQAVSVLGQSSSPAALDVLARALHDPVSSVRLVAAFAIGSLGLRGGIAVLEEARATESDPAVSRALARSLERLSGAT